MNEEMEGDARENITEMSVTQSGIVYFEGQCIIISVPIHLFRQRCTNQHQTEH